MNLDPEVSTIDCSDIFRITPGKHSYEVPEALSNMIQKHHSMEPLFYVNSHIQAEIHLKLLISQGKFSGPRKFTLRYQ